MNRKTRLSVIAASVLVSMGLAAGVYAAKGDSAPKMGFFVSSVGSGKGADLGGLAGADKLCQSLAAAAGAGGRTWHAYLSTTASGSEKAVNARDRIGKGPWYNAKGVLIAKNVDDLYSNPNLTKQTALTEKGAVVNGRGDTPNMHDILTGSDTQGRAFVGGSSDTTCGNWTKSTPTGSAQVGHSDRTGLREDVAAKAWANSHPSRGCSQDALKSSGGDGRFYCFAAK
ncbi:MAG: lectin [Betaproteobacteria bacterium]